MSDFSDAMALSGSGMRAIIASSPSGSGQRSGLASASARLRVARAGSIATPPTSAPCRRTAASLPPAFEYTASKRLSRAH